MGVRAVRARVQEVPAADGKQDERQPLGAGQLLAQQQLSQPAGNNNFNIDCDLKHKSWGGWVRMGEGGTWVRLKFTNLVGGRFENHQVFQCQKIIDNIQNSCQK